MSMSGATSLRAVFLGTSAFAVPSLRALHAAAAVLAVITQPDRPAGRGRRLQSPPVADAGRALGVPVLQPESLKAVPLQEELRALAPDLLVTAAYGLIIPGWALALPPQGAINVHPSLLPAFRGASPIQGAIAGGAEVTGVTILYVAAALDAGDIIMQRAVEIGGDETAGELEARLAVVGADLLVAALGLIAAGIAPRIPQDHAGATYAGKVSKADGEMRWARPARDLVNHVRAMNPWPCAHTSWRGGGLRIWKAAAAVGEGRPGQVLAAGDAGIIVAAGTDAVALMEVQVEGGRRMTAGEFLRGHRVTAGEMLGT